MISKTIAAALLTTAMMTGVASAQTTTTATKPEAAATTASMHRDGQYRASKLVGVNVYNDANEKIGDINDVILDKSGKVANVILGVGGFLGMGEHDVAVPFEKLKFVNEPVRTATTTTTTLPLPMRRRPMWTAMPAPPPTVRPERPPVPRARPRQRTARSTNLNNWYPDHVVYNATKDQLKAMPQFKY